MPGAGKTMICAAVIEDLWMKFGNNSRIGIAFIYCSYRSEHEQTPELSLSCILAQLIQGLETVPASIQTSYLRHKRRSSSPSLEELILLMRSIIVSLDKTYILIDALDEYSNCRGPTMCLLHELLHLQKNLSLNILVTLRPSIQGIKALLEGATTIEIRANEDDVRKVLESGMSRMPACILKDSQLQKVVKDEITKAIDGMFLLTRLHLQSLQDKLSKKQVVQALQNLPRGQEALNLAYTGAIERIEQQQPGRREKAKQLLVWVTHAKRPLSPIEVQHALAIELDADNSGIGKDDLPECLVIIDEKSDIFRLAHYTTQEYLVPIAHKWQPGAQIEIALVCLKYLSFDEFSRGRCKNDTFFEERLSKYRLLDYSARHWATTCELPGQGP
ncbi:hypothetical protein GGR55DRAFT_150278 [Xylaria sp. FL0064]|nr:hypothetical protein GGR55DRAFT_150278 [Xylaria sp. FL0064]